MRQAVTLTFLAFVAFAAATGATADECASSWDCVDCARHEPAAGKVCAVCKLGACVYPALPLFNETEQACLRPCTATPNRHEARRLLLEAA